MEESTASASSSTPLSPPAASSSSASAVAAAPSAASGPSSSSSIFLNQPIVFDVGTASIKAGYAGDTKPKVVVGTKIGRAKHARIMPGGALEPTDPDARYAGRVLDEHRGAFLLSRPMEKGAVVPSGWDDMTRLWEHCYRKECLNATPDEHPALLTEAPLSPRRHRERTAEVFFETFRCPALHFACPAVLSLYASGRTTGIVLDVGEGVTHTVPVYQGFALPHSISRSDIGGRDVTRHLQLLLRRNGLAFTTTAEEDLTQTIKEQTCYVDPKPRSEQQHAISPPSVPYQLPDGQSVRLGDERFRAPELLFDPSVVGSEEPGVAECLLRSVGSADIDLRQTLLEQIVLAGGSTLTTGFGDRCLNELRKGAPPHTKIRISAPTERAISTWVGGSIVASLATFKSLWVPRAEYEEYGSALVHRRSL